MKELFNSAYDENGDESKFLTELKEEADTQTRLNKEFFAEDAHRERLANHP